MASVSEHYERHLAAVYAWMQGGPHASFERGRAELQAIGVERAGDATVERRQAEPVHRVHHAEQAGAGRLVGEPPLLHARDRSTKRVTVRHRRGALAQASDFGSFF